MPHQNTQGYMISITLEELQQGSTEHPPGTRFAAIPEELLQMSRDLNTQDNIYTRDPIYLLQIKRSYDADPECSDNHCYHHAEWCETIYDRTPTSEDCGEPDGDWKWDEDGPDEQNGWTKRAYRTVWETISWSFTRKDLEDHMELNGHNVKREAHNGEWQIYVDCMFRLPGMNAVRDFLLALTKDEETNE